MARLAWDVAVEKTYESGVDRGVLYVDGLPGVAWNGISLVKLSPEGGGPKPFYLDGVKFHNYSAPEHCGGTIDAYSSPKEFDLCDGSKQLAGGLSGNQQLRVPFGFSFRTKRGNELEGANKGYRIHLIYNALATPTSKDHRSLSDVTNVNALSWAFTTRHIRVPGFAPSAHWVLDSEEIDPAHLQWIENRLYGNDLADTDPTLVSPWELIHVEAGRYGTARYDVDTYA